MVDATQQNRLKVFEMSCLRKIEGVTRRDRIRNEDIFDRLKLSQDIHSHIQQRRLRYFGHESRMGQDRYPKLALEGYVQGQQGRRRPKKRWLDVVKSDCADMGVTVHDAIHLVQDRDAQRRSIAKLPLCTPAGASPRH